MLDVSKKGVCAIFQSVLFCSPLSSQPSVRQSGPFPSSPDKDEEDDLEDDDDDDDGAATRDATYVRTTPRVPARSRSLQRRHSCPSFCGHNSVSVTRQISSFPRRAAPFRRRKSYYKSTPCRIATTIPTPLKPLVLPSTPFPSLLCRRVER